MRYHTQLRSTASLFLSTAVLLAPVGILTFRSNWPPLSWKGIHFANANIGREEFLPISILFLLMALIYHVFPKITHRHLNERLGRIHFLANLVALVLLLAIPLLFNLTFHSNARTPWELFWSGFGTALKSTVWEFAAIVAAQIFLPVNVLWSLFKGKKINKGAGCASANCELRVANHQSPQTPW